MRDNKGRFKRGSSGNPKGRPKGSTNSVTRLRHALADDIDGVIDSVVQAALNGDTAAAKLLLDRVIPTLKPESRTLEPEAAITGETLTDIAFSIFDQSSNGNISTSQALELLNGLAHAAKILEVSELEERLTALEEQSK